MEKTNKKRCLEDDSNCSSAASLSGGNNTLNETWPRFLIISGNIDSLSPFAVEKGILALAGEPKSVKRLKSGDLLVEVTRKAHSDLLLKSTTLALVPITVTPHGTLNFKKGVIRCRELARMSETEIQQALSDQHVAEVKRISVKRDGSRVQTNTYILTFKSCSLPQSIKVGYLRVPVEMYVPNPMRCFKCQRFGHHRDNCRSHELCARCGGNDHSSETCQLEPRCVNCEGSHWSNSRDCPKWRTEKQILQIKVTKNVSYPEAKKQLATQVQTPTMQKSYAAAASQPRITTASIETQTEITWHIDETTYSIYNKSAQTKSTHLESTSMNNISQKVVPKPSVQTQHSGGGTSKPRGNRSSQKARSKSQEPRGAGAPKSQPEVSSGSGALNKPRTRDRKGDQRALLLENPFDVLSDETEDME